MENIERRFTVRSLAVVCLSIFLVACQTTPAAEPTPPCDFTAEQLRSTLEERFPDVKEMILTGDRKDKFLLAFNSEEPVSHYTAHTILIFYSRKANARKRLKTSVMTMVDRTGCVTRNGEVLTENLIKWLPLEV